MGSESFLASVAVGAQLVEFRACPGRPAELKLDEPQVATGPASISGASTAATPGGGAGPARWSPPDGSPWDNFFGTDGGATPETIVLGLGSRGR